MTRLTMTHVKKEFVAGKGRVQALQDMTLTLESGKILGLLGPNGSGKTTTVRIACGLLTADSGEVTVLGKDIRKSRSDIVMETGVLLEPGRGIYKNMTALENIVYWGILKGMLNRRKLLERALELLEFFDIEKKKDALSSTLSTGMVQKLNLCMTLVTDPKLILLDEPNVGMDLESSIGLVGKLRHLTETRGCSILVTSHQMDFMEDLCDEVAFISAGKVVQKGTVTEVRWLLRQKHYRLVFEKQGEMRTEHFAGLKTLAFRDNLPDNMVELILDSSTVDSETLMRFALEHSLGVVALELVQPSLKECYQMMFAEGGELSGPS